MSLYTPLLRITATVRHRTDSVDAHGDVATSETLQEGVPCHAYQRFRTEFTDGTVIGVDELVVHLMADIEVSTGDRIDLAWPSGRTIAGEIIGPPARRVNARQGRVHHIEVRVREIH